MFISKLSRGISNQEIESFYNYCVKSANLNVIGLMIIPPNDQHTKKYFQSINETNKIRSSTGVMASWMSPIGPMTFTLAQNLSKADSDETESFNFNLGTTF